MDIEEAVASLVSQQRIIVRTVDISLMVSDVPGTIDVVADLAEGMGGWVISTNRSRKHRGSISVRVPAAQLDEAVLRLREMAVEVESEVSTSRDVTDEYVDATARLENLLSAETTYRRLLEESTTDEGALRALNELTRLQGDIESLQGRIKLLEETSAFSLINVTLEQEPADMPVDAAADQPAGGGEIVRFRALFKPPEGTEDFVFTWDFGDGSRLVTSDRTAPTEEEDTRVTATVTHQYHDERDSPFIAEVKMTAVGEAGLAEGEDTLIVTVTRIPTIEVFAGDSVQVEEGQEIELSGSFTRPEGVTDVRFEWDFGDGSAIATGVIEGGATNAVATHVYPDHRPFPFRATLKVAGQSDAGKVEGSNSVQVRVTEARGWVIAGWSLSEQGKTAVRSLSGVGQGLVNLLIWAAIFSPIWIAVGFAAFLGWRRLRNIRARRRKSLSADE